MRKRKSLGLLQASGNSSERSDFQFYPWKRHLDHCFFPNLSKRLKGETRTNTGQARPCEEVTRSETRVRDRSAGLQKGDLSKRSVADVANSLSTQKPQACRSRLSEEASTGRRKISQQFARVKPAGTCTKGCFENKFSSRGKRVSQKVFSAETFTSTISAAFASLQNHKRQTRSLTARVGEDARVKLKISLLEKDGEMIEVIDLSDSSEETEHKATEGDNEASDVPRRDSADGAESIIDSLKSLQLQGVSDRLEPLNREERQVLARVMDLSKDQTASLAKIPEANIVLRREDFLRLRGNNWLNDELLNSYVALLNSRNEKTRTSSSDTSRTPRIYCFNTFFFTKLTSGKQHMSAPPLLVSLICQTPLSSRQKWL